MSGPRIAVIGGGISGLTAAFHLAEARRAGVPLEEFLIEAAPYLGGALHTERVDGCLVEAGADSFLTEKPEASELCQGLGLGEQLIGSQDEQRRTLILHRGKLVPLPEGFEFLVPTRPWAVAGTPLLSLRDKLALATEVFHRAPSQGGDESVAQFVERHFSRGLVENIVDPLLAAVYGGDAGMLSARSTLPRFVELERQWGSLVRGMRRAVRKRASQSGGQNRPPIFTTLRDGLQTLVGALQDRLESRRVLCGRRVAAISVQASPENETRYRLELQGNESMDVDAVVLALPTYEAARLVRPLDAALADGLSEIPYSSSMIVAVGYDARAVGALPTGFGFLVPRKERRRLLACTFVGQKFPHRVPSDRVLLRFFLGGVRDEDVLQLSDEEATGVVRGEVQSILDLAAEPLFAKVYRWRKAMAQYTVGHGDRLESISKRLAEHPGLFLCGNAYQGIGIPDCVRSGRTAAEKCLDALLRKQAV